MARLMVIALAVMASGVALAASANPSTTASAPSDQRQICKMVVSAEPGAKPHELCMTKSEWDAKKIADAKDPNRLICRYEEESGTRFRSTKVCMTAAEWENERLRQRQEVERIQMQTCVPGAGC
ncbi:MAG TPA: hypothetical protein VJM15_11105 [Sphingomicrobium sp.]|nr:hypothetical protein [Sphingomicrobium sp.]